MAKRPDGNETALAPDGAVSWNLVPDLGISSTSPQCAGLHPACKIRVRRTCSLCRTACTRPRAPWIGSGRRRNRSPGSRGRCTLVTMSVGTSLSPSLNSNVLYHIMEEKGSAGTAPSGPHTSSRHVIASASALSLSKGASCLCEAKPKEARRTVHPACPACPEVFRGERGRRVLAEVPSTPFGNLRQAQDDSTRMRGKACY